MEIAVSEAADVLGVSERRVRALIASGRVGARRVGGRWLVDGASLPHAPYRGRPMSRSVAWAFAHDAEPDAVSPKESYVRRRRRAQLAADSEPERRLEAWLARRAVRSRYAAREPRALLADDRVVASGLSDPRAAMSAADIAEGYVRESDLDAVVRRHLLRPAGADGNVVLHIVLELPHEPVPVLLVAADLAEHGGARELARSRELIREAVA